MSRFTDSLFAPHLEVVATLAERQVEASIEDMRRTDEVTLALREMLKMGASIDDLSDATGLPPADIKRRTESQLNVMSDIADLAGTR